MKKNFSFIFTLLIFLTLLYSENNTLDYKGQKVYVSAFGDVNSKYYTSNGRKFIKLLKNFFENSSLEKDPTYNFEFKKLDLPDSLTKNFLEIKKGFSAVLFDSTDFDFFEINDFKATICSGTGNTRVSFSTPKYSNYSRKKLILISENKKVFDDLTIQRPNISNNSEINSKILEKLTTYLYNNRNQLNQFMSDYANFPDTLSYFPYTLSYNQFKKKIIENKS